jgi:transposase InsO family protein
MRGPYAKVADKNRELVDRIRVIKADRPFWGYRRVWAYLRYVEEMEVNKKRIYRLMREHDLLAKPDMKLKAKRGSARPKPRPDRLNQWWGIDMTKVMVDGFGWIYVVIVLDWYTKKIVGHYAGVQSKAWHWLVALNKAVNRQFPDGARDKGLKLMADNGCQPTSASFMRACRAMGITQAFTSYNNPKGNADTERMMRTIKEELVWLREWSNPNQFIQALDEWVEQYNEGYLHSALGYMPPNTFEEREISRNTLFAEAC